MRLKKTAVAAGLALATLVTTRATAQPPPSFFHESPTQMALDSQYVRAQDKARFRVHAQASTEAARQAAIAALSKLLASPSTHGMRVGATPTLSLPTGSAVNTPATVSAAINAIFSYYATLASPNLTGAPTVPTATLGDTSTKAADDAYVMNEAAALVGVLAPTYNPVFTGTVTVPTAVPGTNSVAAANTAFVTSALGSFQGNARTGLAGVAGAGTGTIASAAIMNSNENEVTTCGSGTAVALPTGAVVFQPIYISIRCTAGQTMLVLPDTTGDTIESGAAGVGVTLTSPVTVRFFKISNTQWLEGG